MTIVIQNDKQKAFIQFPKAFMPGPRKLRHQQSGDNAAYL